MSIVFRDPYSQVPFLIKLKFQDTELATASGFLVRKGDRLFLVSNWHNFSGRNPQTGKFLSAHGGVPDRASCYLIRSGKFVERQWVDFQLADTDGPLWWEHPEHGGEVDVGLLPVTLPVEIRAFTFDDLESTPMQLRVSHDVFILGYPLGLMDAKGMPVWKRASVATEPGKTPLRFLVDTATRPGMSGSPVLMRYRGFYKNDPAAPNVKDNDWFGEGDLFVGVYSGRLGASDIEAQLGIVWKAVVIDQIIDGKKRAGW